MAATSGATAEILLGINVKKFLKGMAKAVSASKRGLASLKKHQASIQRGAMVAGVAFWTMSFLRFQADMGLLLVFWMIISMLGGLILLPTLIVILKPKFIVGKKAKA